MRLDQEDREQLERAGSGLLIIVGTFLMVLSGAWVLGTAVAIFLEAAGFR